MGADVRHLKRHLLPVVLTLKVIKPNRGEAQLGLRDHCQPGAQIELLSGLNRKGKTRAPVAVSQSPKTVSPPTSRPAPLSLRTTSPPISISQIELSSAAPVVLCSADDVMRSPPIWNHSGEPAL